MSIMFPTVTLNRAFLMLGEDRSKQVYTQVNRRPQDLVWSCTGHSQILLELVILLLIQAGCFVQAICQLLVSTQNMHSLVTWAQGGRLLPMIVSWASPPPLSSQCEWLLKEENPATAQEVPFLATPFLTDTVIQPLLRRLHCELTNFQVLGFLAWRSGLTSEWVLVATHPAPHSPYHLNAPLPPAS